MSDFQPQGGEFPENPSEGPGHELSDLRINGLAAFLVSLVVMTILVLVVGGLTMRFFVGVERVDEKLRPASFQEAEGQYPQPRLQETPRIELAEFREAERRVTESYGWVNQKAGVVRIPVDRAIEILAERDLPKGRNTPPRGSRTRDQK